MKHFLIITITLLFLISPLTVQYKETGFLFQHDVNGKSLCGDDEDEDEDEDEDADEDDKNVGETVNIPPTSPTSCTNSVTVVGKVAGPSSNLVTTALVKSANYSKGLTVFGINILATKVQTILKG